MNSFPVISQITYHYVGTSNLQNTISTYPSVYGNYYQGVRNQMIIKASEMNLAGMSAGNITGIAFDVVSNTGNNIENFEISIGNTSQNSLSSWDDSLITVLTSIIYLSSVTWTKQDWLNLNIILIDVCSKSNIII